jgi:O-acetyl-ADP-ribose deacetylase (regulator of RNase III)
MSAKGFFKGMARLVREFRIEVGPIKARGVPAILVAVTGVVVAGGIAAALSRAAGELPETLRQANGLAKTLRGDESPRLPS